MIRGILCLSGFGGLLPMKLGLGHLVTLSVSTVPVGQLPGQFSEYYLGLQETPAFATQRHAPVY